MIHQTSPEEEVSKMIDEANEQHTVEIWLRKHVFSITLDRVAAVRHSKAIKVGDVTISVREADASSVREAALAKAERLSMMKDLYSGVEVTVEETSCTTSKEAYKVTINFHDPEKPGSGTLLLRRMDNQKIYDFFVIGRTASPHYDKALATTRWLFEAACTQHPHKNPLNDAIWYRFNELWLPIPHDLAPPNDASIDLAVSEAFVDEHLKFSAFEDVHTGCPRLDTEPGRVLDLRRGLYDEGRIDRWDSGPLRLTCGTGEVSVFTFVPNAFSLPLLKDNEDDQWDLFEINSSAQASDGAGNCISLSARSAMANPGNWQSMVTDHARRMIELLESVVIQRRTL